MKTTRFLLFITLLLTGLAQAQTTTYVNRYALETPVNIRAGQGSKHDIVVQLKENERFEMDASCKSGWCKAKVGSVEGYVHISQAKQEPAKATAVEAAMPAETNATATDKAQEEGMEWTTILFIVLGIFVLIIGRKFFIGVIVAMFAELLRATIEWIGNGIRSLADRYNK